MTTQKILQDGIQNWKLRLVLSGLLSIIGLSALIAMILGTVFGYNQLDRTIIGLSVFMVGLPLYLILSELPKINEKIIVHFLEELEGTELEFPCKPNVLLMESSAPNDDVHTQHKQMLDFFAHKPLYKLLPVRPVLQGYILFLVSFSGSLLIWYLS